MRDSREPFWYNVDCKAERDGPHHPALSHKGESFESLLAGETSVEFKHLVLKDRGEVVVASLKSGTIIDQNIIEQIGAELQHAALEASGTRKLLLSFEHVQHMSSAMLGKLMMLHKRCKADKIKLKFCAISSNLMEVFTITNLTRIFDIQKDEACAVDAF